MLCSDQHAASFCCELGVKIFRLPRRSEVSSSYEYHNTFTVAGEAKRATKCHAVKFFHLGPSPSHCGFCQVAVVSWSKSEVLWLVRVNDWPGFAFRQGVVVEILAVPE